MPYIIYSTTASLAVCRNDGALADISLRPGEIAIPCDAGADPNDPRWADEAALYDEKYALINARAFKLGEINRACEAALSQLKDGYPEGEVQSWERQFVEAVAWQANPAASTPTLAGIATARGITRDDLVGRVLVKANLFAIASGQIIGRRQMFEDVIAEASIEALAEMTWQSEPLSGKETA